MTDRGDPWRVDQKYGAATSEGRPVPTGAGPTTAPRRLDHDATIRSIGVRQHAVVTRGQLVEAGVPKHAVDYRLQRGRLRPLYRGVYGVGPLPARYERWAAAVLACGPTAALSHHSAAVLWKLRARRPDAPIHVSIRRGRRGVGPRVRVHRVPGLREDEVTSLEGIRLTTPARTVLDLAGALDARELERVVAGAEREGTVTVEEIAALLERYPRRAGSRVLRALLAPAEGPAFTRSEAERRFLALVRRARMRRPEANVRIVGHEVDFVWRRERLVVEVDGFAFHSSAGAFERDRRRDQALAAAGFHVFRVTWKQLTGQREALLVLLGQALARAGTS